MKNASIIMNGESNKILDRQKTEAVDSYSTNPSSSVPDLAFWIISLLQLGTLVSASLVLVGSVSYLASHGFEPRVYQNFQGIASPFNSMAEVMQGLHRGESLALVQMGLLMLVATPVLRVTITCLIFAFGGDITYAFITLFVLMTLTYSFMGIRP